MTKLPSDAPWNGIASRIAAHRERLEQEPGSWPAKRQLAASLRALIDALCASEAPPDELLTLAGHIDEAAARLRAQPAAPAPLDTGMETFGDRGPLVGLANPIAPPVAMAPDMDARVVRGSVEFGAAYEGGPGLVHGGFLAAVLDEALGMACIFSGHPGMTGELTLRYERATPIHVPLRFEARCDGREGRRILTSGEIRVGERVSVRASGVFIAVDDETFSDFAARRRERPGGPAPPARDQSSDDD